MRKRSGERQPSPWDVLTVKEAAETKGVTVNAIYYAINANLLPAEQRGKIWLIRRVDLEQYQPNPRIEEGRRAKREAESQSEAQGSELEVSGSQTENLAQE